MTDDQEIMIINMLSAQIATHLRARCEEEAYPQRDSDAMDDYIAHHSGCAGQLRRIRAELEEIFAKPGSR